MELQTSFMVSELERKFRDFHTKNPKVYSHLVRLARQAKDRGKRKIGIAMLFEIVRWEIWLQTTDKNFKLSNNHRAYYARLIMDQEPDLKGIFNIKELRA